MAMICTHRLNNMMYLCMAYFCLFNKHQECLRLYNVWFIITLFDELYVRVYLFIHMWTALHLRHNSVQWSYVRLCYICNEKPYIDWTKSSLCFILSSDFIIGDNVVRADTISQRTPFNVTHDRILSLREEVRGNKTSILYTRMNILNPIW